MASNESGHDRETLVRDDNSDSDINPDASESSTIEYEQTPFAIMSETVRSWAHGIFCSHIESDSHSCTTIDVERARGGGFNRIIRILVKAPKRKIKKRVRGKRWIFARGPPEKYILRLPRFEDDSLPHQVALLLFLGHNTSIPTPHIVSFSSDCDYVFHKPFILMKHLPGRDLYDIASRGPPSFENSLRIARDTGHALRAVLQVRSKAAGYPVVALAPVAQDTKYTVYCTADLERSKSDTTFPLCVEPFPGVDNFLTDADHPSLLSPTYRIVNAILGARFATVTEDDYLRPFYQAIQDTFCGMEGEGMFSHTEAECVLRHVDLEGRNIFVDLTTKPEKNCISGLLDWDGAMMVPMFMACIPPVFLWDGSASATSTPWHSGRFEARFGRLDNFGAIPSTEEGCHLRAAFDDAVGSEYCRYAYADCYAIARSLFLDLVEGIRREETMRRIMRMAGQWKTLARPVT